MPWRKNTLTRFEFGTGSESVASIHDSHSSVLADDLDLKGSNAISELDFSDEHLSRFVPGDVEGSGRSQPAASSFQVVADQGHFESESQIDEKSTSVEPLNASQFGKLVSHAFLGNAKIHDIEMPWESSFAKKIFSDDIGLESSLVVPPLLQKGDINPGTSMSHEVVQELADRAKSNLGCGSVVFLRAIKNTVDISESDKRKKILESACFKWMTLLEFDRSSVVSQKIMEHLESDGSDVYNIVEAVIGVKSPYTAMSRANSLLAYVRWVLNVFPSAEYIFQEDLVWQYFSMLRDRSSSPTSASSAMSAFRYAHFVFGFDVLSSVVNSRRLVGLSEILYSQKEALRQAKIISVSDVKRLHQCLEDHNRDVFDRASAGFILLGIYGRSRHSDLCNIDHIVQDFDESDGYIELFTRVHKSARGAVRKALFLPILIPVLGVTGTNWVVTLNDVFLECGLKLDGSIKGPLLRPPSRSCPGLLCDRSVSSGECGALLRGLLGEELEAPGRDVVAHTSHSMKSTSLSWAAKFGLSDFDRAVLGRHSTSTSSTTAVYSRDLSIRSVALFKEVIQKISTSEFRPDAPRSQYFSFPPEPPAQVAPVIAQPEVESGVFVVDNEVGDNMNSSGTQPLVCEGVEVKMEPVVDGAMVIEGCVEISDSECSEVSSIGSVESMSEDEVPSRRVKSRRKLDRVDASKGQWFFHKKSKLLHMCCDGGEFSFLNRRFFMCGKVVSENYQIMSEAEAGYVICVLCHRKVR